MPSAREVRNRIRSIKNIGQITRALEAVSASRVRRAQARVLASRAFAEKAWEILLNVQNSAAKGTPLHPLLTPRAEVRKTMIVLVTSDRGLAGAFNANIIRVARRFQERMGVPVSYIAIGRKGRDSLVRARQKLAAEFPCPSEPTIAFVSPIMRLVTDAFLSGEVDEVFIAYTDFINTLTQRPRVSRLLPLIPYETTDQALVEYVKDVPMVSATGADYDYEPNAAAILDEIVPRFTLLQLYQGILESQASEHSARMVAMRNASDNASQLAEDYTLLYNKARQAGITAEILDIVGGAEALQATLDKSAEAILQAARLSSSIIQPTGANGASQSATAGKPDDLTKIEGIGPKMAAALKKAGIDTFAKLAASSEADLRAAITAAGMNFSPSLPTWAEQASYAARGDFDGLKQYQSQLVGGRKA
ncbi:MAG: ATP synthase F1 subunit gamma [Anaerolineae bacterium]|nr:ATP synthase F1 subunit gamma [Anaerolineae bacterium]NUQ05026.1 ATP synthase F1 subunit gamma [Anaerolineae bacterium]